MSHPRSTTPETTIATLYATLCSGAQRSIQGHGHTLAAIEAYDEFYRGLSTSHVFLIDGKRCGANPTAIARIASDLRGGKKMSEIASDFDDWSGSVVEPGYVAAQALIDKWPLTRSGADADTQDRDVKSA